jgi:hypothetical protein
MIRITLYELLERLGPDTKIGSTNTVRVNPSELRKVADSFFDVKPEGKNFRVHGTLIMPDANLPEDAVEYD